jgi:ATP-dependent DNA helicase RecG
MRPTVLNPLFASVTALPGIADKVEKLYRRLFGRDTPPRALDLVRHLPTGAVDRRAQPKLAEVVPGSVVTVAVTIDQYRRPPPNRPRAPYLVYASDETGTLTIAYFSPRRDMIEKLLPVGSRRYVSGTVAVYDGMLQMAHPDRVADEAGFAAMALVEPVYPLTEGLTANMLRRHVAAALARVPAFPEWLDPTYVARAGWPDFAGALATLHRPAEPADLARDGKAWSRLAYDELMASQLALALVRRHLRRSGSRRAASPSPGAAAPSPVGEGRGAGAVSAGREEVTAATRVIASNETARPTPPPPSPPPRAGEGKGGCDPPPAGEGEGKQALAHRLTAALPFRLTRSQLAAIADIRGDLAKPERMLRLLQGDVGSGKTVVALFACAAAIEAGTAGGASGSAGPGAQAALMAPTELLARQHWKTIAPLAQSAGIRAAILTGRERGSERTRLLEQLRQGEIDLLIGTHALYSDDVAFRDLALVVIDEQHRFGVEQRLALARKGHAVDMLVMTATPIPRTLVLAFFGDMDISELRDKPAGRKPIATRAVPLDRLSEVTDAVGRALAQNRRVYWVCPLVEDNTAVDLAAAQARYEALRATFGPAVGLVHGRTKGADKDAAMARFAAGETRLLVATTVIEVGVDVPDASVMVIEHAERYGLAQLHQLRGRVGRGRESSTCLLLYKAPLGDTAKARLAVMRDTEDGFRIAEEDLRLRGGGDVLGIRQSGMPGFRIADLAVHHDLMAAARDDAALVLARDAALTGERAQALRLLLYLFERDEAVRLIAAG